MATKKRKTKLTLYSGAEVTIYEGSKLQAALAEVVEDITLYKGVRLTQIFEAIYNQGKRDGAKAAFHEITKGITEAQKRVPHRTPGRPRKNME